MFHNVLQRRNKCELQADLFILFSSSQCNSKTLQLIFLFMCNHIYFVHIKIHFLLCFCPTLCILNSFTKEVTTKITIQEPLIVISVIRCAKEHRRFLPA